MEAAKRGRGQEWGFKIAAVDEPSWASSVRVSSMHASHTPPYRPATHTTANTKVATSGWAASCPGQPAAGELEEGKEEAMQSSFYRQAIIGRRDRMRS